MKPRIAWVSPYLPAPRTSGGVLRIQELAGHLHTEFELHLFCRGELWERRRLGSPELEAFSTRWMGRDLWQGAVAGLPRKVRRGSPRALYRRIAREHARTPFDAMVLCHCWSAWGAFDLGIPTLLDEHNIESAYLADWFRARKVPTAQANEQVALLRQWERRAWALATEVTCVSKADSALIAQARESPAIVVANGARVRAVSEAPMSPRGTTLLFVGALHHPPNASAALRLASRIMPLLWRTHPQATLDIVGPAPSRELSALNSERLRVHGLVPTVRPFVERCAAFVFPLEHGAGSSLKTIEAIAAGAPLVSSELGARGFGLFPGEHYTRAESDAEFAAALGAVLDQPQAFVKQSEAARAVAQRYDWQAQAGIFAEVLRHTLARPQLRPARG